MDETERKIISIIDTKREELIRLGSDLFHHGERGFAEYKTAERMSSLLKEIGKSTLGTESALEIREGLAGTGIKASIGPGIGPNIAVICELDGIHCPEHPQAAKSGMSHACGHNVQMTAMAGAAFALCEPEVLSALNGRVTFFCVPAEEYLGVEVRDSLHAAGILSHSGGKAELICRGEFDDIDIALTSHVHMLPYQNADLAVGNNACSGFIGKTIVIRGKAAHAAIAPHEGINALNAAALGLTALGMVRETFREEDYIRVHPILKKGGAAVNVVPEEAVVDMMVRGKTIEAIEETSKKVDRAFQGAAYALGADIKIRDSKGYLPVIERTADRVMLEAARLLKGVRTVAVTSGLQNTASTDVGDLTHLLPVLNVTCGGTKGVLHSKDFQITDPDTAYLATAKVMALTVYKLLKNQAYEAIQIKKEFRPVFTRDEYIQYIES